MICMNCGSKRLAEVTGKVNDSCSIQLDGYNYEGYVPYDMPFGEGDYIKFQVCLQCGHMNGEDWPCSAELEEPMQDW